ncbi:Mur ligase family protein [Methanopyrus sp.]
MSRVIVVGAGSAGRSVARLLNHAGYDVVINDVRDWEDFTTEEREYLEILEREGVEVVLGGHYRDLFESADAAFVSPAIPEDAEGRKLAELVPEKITVEDVAGLLRDLFPVPAIGITGTNGKTTTTWAVAHLLEASGYEVWRCSSLDRHLVIEAIVEGVVTGEIEDYDVAVVELPHGTIRLAAGIELDVGVLTNVSPEHLDEFGGSFERYVRRKLTITEMSEVLVACYDCEELRKRLNDAVWYSVRDPNADYYGSRENERLVVRGPDVSMEADFHLIGYYVENCTGAVAACLEFGVDPECLVDGLATFEGVPGRMELLGELSGRVAYIDAAHNPDGLKASLPSFRELADERDRRLLVSVDNPDTVTERDKFEFGRIVGKYADFVAASGYNETLERLDRSAAEEVVKGAESAGCEGVAVDSVREAAEEVATRSEEGDVLLHIGPGVVNAYDRVKRAFLRGLTSVLGGPSDEA